MPALRPLAKGNEVPRAWRNRGWRESVECGRCSRDGVIRVPLLGFGSQTGRAEFAACPRRLAAMPLATTEAGDNARRERDPEIRTQSHGLHADRLCWRGE